MSQNLPGNGFEWIGSTNFTKDFIGSYDENSSVWYIPKVYVKYPEELRISNNEIRFFPKNEKNK